MNLLPQTELEAVNVCLQNINESPVNTLSAVVGDAQMAQHMLHDNSRKIQSIGLVCNTDYEYELQQDSSKHVYVPSNALKVITTSTDRDIVQRGNRLYDRVKNTYVLDDNIKVTLVSFLEWTDLPQTVRNYITINTARKFAVQVVGDSDLWQLTQQDEIEALIEFKREQVNTEQANILSDSEAAYSVINRTRDYPNYGI